MCQYKADHWGKEQVNKIKNLLSTIKEKKDQDPVIQQQVTRVLLST